MSVIGWDLENWAFCNSQACIWVQGVHFGIPAVVVDGVSLCHPQHRALPWRDRRRGDQPEHVIWPMGSIMMLVLNSRLQETILHSSYAGENWYLKPVGEIEQSKLNFLLFSQRLRNLCNGIKWIIFQLFLFSDPHLPVIQSRDWLATWYFLKPERQNVYFNLTV